MPRKPMLINVFFIIKIFIYNFGRNVSGLILILGLLAKLHPKTTEKMYLAIMD
jgi:hypothetical protein